MFRFNVYLMSLPFLVLKFILMHAQLRPTRWLIFVVKGAIPTSIRVLMCIASFMIIYVSQDYTGVSNECLIIWFLYCDSELENFGRRLGLLTSSHLWDSEWFSFIFYF